VEPISPDDLFFSPLDEGSPGAQVHLYRLLHLLATQGVADTDALPVSYAGAKKIASRLSINSAERLGKLFKYMGFGTLTMDVQPDVIRVAVAGYGPSGQPEASDGIRGASHKHLCDFQRGLIDGGLQLITGMPVTSGELECSFQGGSHCVFEAVRNDVSGSGGFVPTGSGLDCTGAGYTSSTAKGMRSWFMELAGRELARARRHNRQVSLLYIDIDDLGSVNTTFGRPAGDELISAAGTAISRTCRAEDYLWHHGEDEFAIILSETDAGTAAKVAERLAVQIRAAAELIDVSTALSACIGFATFPDNAQTVFDLFKTAKSALYLAKAAGKGEVHGAEALPGETSGRAVDGRPQRENAAGGRGERRGQKSDGSASAESDANMVQRRNRARIQAAAEARLAPGPAGEESNYSVVVASINHLVLAGMKHELEAATGIEIAGEFTRSAALMTFIDDVRPDIVLVDTEIAVADDFSLPRFIAEQNLPCKMIVIVEEVDQDVVKLAADHKVEGMVTQNSAPADLLSALDTVYEGRVVVPDKIRATLSELESSRRVLGELSDRELEVLRLVAAGKSNSQISDELFITVNTVRFHLANIYQKLSVSNRTEAANYFLRQDMPPEDQTRLL